MAPRSEPRIVDAERIDGGVLITFEDGRCAFYPALLLEAHLSQAIAVEDSD
jgi:hypothetical protein